MRRYLYLSLGFVFVALAALGVALPGLPTTPFLLLAAACFARSSERWHRWLRDSTLFGPLLRDWEQHRCIACRTKVFALVMMLGVGGTSIVLVLQQTWLQATVGGLLLVGVFSVWRIPNCPQQRA